MSLSMLPDPNMQGLLVKGVPSSITHIAKCGLESTEQWPTTPKKNFMSSSLISRRLVVEKSKNESRLLWQVQKMSICKNAFVEDQSENIYPLKMWCYIELQPVKYSFNLNHNNLISGELSKASGMDSENNNLHFYLTQWQLLFLWISVYATYVLVYWARPVSLLPEVGPSLASL